MIKCPCQRLTTNHYQRGIFHIFKHNKNGWICVFKICFEDGRRKPIWRMIRYDKYCEMFE